MSRLKIKLTEAIEHYNVMVRKQNDPRMDEDRLAQKCADNWKQSIVTVKTKFSRWKNGTTSRSPKTNELNYVCKILSVDMNFITGMKPMKTVNHEED